MFANLPLALWIAVLAVWFSSSISSLAEKYLTVSEAQKLCFPDADRFESHILRIAPDQAKAIEKKSGVKVHARGHRIWLAHQGSKFLGVLVLDHVLGKHEMIDYAVALSPKGSVLQVEVLEYRESHGGEIRGSRWRSQFKGKTADTPLRLNEDIYNISGATISCRNVSQGIKRVLATFEEVVGSPHMLVASELPKSAKAAHP